jgi:hypothetical protein
VNDPEVVPRTDEEVEAEVEALREQYGEGNIPTAEVPY